MTLNLNIGQKKINYHKYMEPSEKRELLREQLNHLYKLLEVNLRTRTIIKGWCVTTLLALIIISYEKEFLIERYMIIIIIIFWFIETIEGARTFLYGMQMSKIEKKIIENRDIEESDFAVSMYKKLTRAQKIKFFYIKAFTGETIISFYGGILFLILFFYIPFRILLIIFISILILILIALSEKKYLFDNK